MMEDDLSEVLLQTAEIDKRLDQMAAQITEEYRGLELTVLSIMSGSLMFGADLLRRIPLPLRIICISVSSYHGGINSTGKVTFHLNSLPDLQGRHVLLLDDILDTGLTLHAMREKLEKETSPLSVKICVLLRKSVDQPRPIDADYIGFDIVNEFVVGYGLDYQEKYRNLPYLGILRPELVKA